MVYELEKEHKQSSLMCKKKEELVKEIQRLEHNVNVLNERLNVQANAIKHYEQKSRNNAIDEFAEKLKERLKGMQMAEMQGEDVCPYGDTLEECPYINQELGCQYCAREQTIKDVDEIAEQMKGGE